MVLAVDASTPANVNQTSGTTAAATTASFTPPAGSLLLIFWAGNSASLTDTPADPTITDNLGVHLTYTKVQGANPTTASSTATGGQAFIWWAPVTTSAAMTITVTNQAVSGFRHAGLQVVVLTGADTTSPIELSGIGKADTAPTAITQNYTPTANAGMGFLVFCDWNNGTTAAPGAGTGCTRIAGVAASNITYGYYRRTSPDDAPGIQNTVRTGTWGSPDPALWAWVDIAPPVTGPTLAETATGTDALTVPTQTHPLAETGTAVDALTVDAGPTPGAILNIGSGAGQNHFDLQMARTGDASWTLVTQSQIAAGYSETPYFITVGNAVQFYARLDAPVVGSSTSSRAELREVNANGTEAAFDANVGVHEMHGFTKIMHMPPVKPDTVIAQLHNGSADRISIRTQLVTGTIRLRLRINGTSVTVSNTGTLDLVNPYVPGTEFEWKIRVVNGAISVFYNNMTTPVYTAPAGTLAATAGVTTWYFKTGCYNQSDPVTDAGTEYGQTELRGLTVSHGEVAIADTGSAADALTVKATVPVADTGAAADTLTLGQTTAFAETGTVADALTVKATVPVAETGTAVDAATVKATVPVTDTATAADAATVKATVPVADTGRFTDAQSVVVASLSFVPGFVTLASNGVSDATLAATALMQASLASDGLRDATLTSNGLSLATLTAVPPGDATIN